ncbi:LANO_0E15720g1_1 [Lachancea nothofagi CBS 11611]|uniref:Xylulose kinase n=1 Tax=Lachancea nothofagi CBS 11611 TaxID=1266666 RepID=A0A1G4K1A1_9SACH|nr:LANO_0E15720g1_1 [Lachancea nothofagi CBS 11611]
MIAMSDETEALYLGFDLSTQQLKCLVIDQNLKLLHSETIGFDKDLCHYKTEKGVYFRDDGTAECPVAMWLEAIDMVFDRMSKQKHIDLSLVKAMSGSCQQHGSVYWTKEGPKLLKKLDVKETLKNQLSPQAFSRNVAPNWQDHSTGEECQKFEDSCGGAAQLANITGSRAHHRFTGPQMMKISKKEPETYAKTDKISLVSSFLASILAGEYTPLEEADACGMNLYDVEKRDYDEALLQNVDQDTKRLRKKLGGNPIPSEHPKPVGTLSSYFVEKYGLNPSCQIFPFTGDNLATICSLPLKPNDVLVSLGTSTTILLVTDQYHPSPNYHLFLHPTIPHHYMGMICYCNGALARESIRDQLSNSHDLELFNKAVNSSMLNNDNEIACYFPLGEIVPNVPSSYRRATFSKSADGMGVQLKLKDAFDSVEHDAKNIVESQALSCRVRISPLLSKDCADVNCKMGDSVVHFDCDNFPLSEYTKRPRRAFFVGGASKNDAIVNRFAQILGATEGNYRLETPNSCALGGCYRALWSHLYYEGVTSAAFDQFLNKAFRWETDVQSLGVTDEKSWLHYNSKIHALSELEKTL